MDDFFGNVARQVLGAAPEIGPKLPSRFEAWPDLPWTDVAFRPQASADAPADADAVPFPPPLIDPDGPDASGSLPTFRQMSERRAASQPAGQSGQPSMFQVSLESADFEPAVAHSPSPSAASTLPPAPEAAPGQAGSAMGGAAQPVEVQMGASTEAAAEPVEVQTPSHAPASRPLTVPPAAPQPVPVVQRRAASGGPSIGLPTAGMNPVAEPRLAVATEAAARPATAAPPLATGSPPPVSSAGRFVAGERGPAVVPVPALAAGQTESPTVGVAQPIDMPPPARELESMPFTTPPAAPEFAPAVPWPALPGGQASGQLAIAADLANEPRLPVTPEAEASPATAAPPLATGSRQPVPSVGRFVVGQREPAIAPASAPAPGQVRSLAEAVAPPVEMPPPARTQPSTPLIVPSAAPELAPVVPRRVGSRGPLTAPLATETTPAIEPDQPDSTEGKATPATPTPASIAGAREPTSPAGRVAGGREPAIEPVPEPASGRLGWTTGREAARLRAGELEPVPTVRVTIGRVVVQAAPAELRPPPRRVELPRPPLSLEAYLQGRQGGER